MQSELRGVEQAALCRRFGLSDLVEPSGLKLLTRMSRESLRRM